MAVNDLQEMQRRLQTPTMRDNMPQGGQPAMGMQQPQQPMMQQQAPMMQPPMPEIKQNLNEVLTATLPDGDSIAVKALEGLVKKSGTVVQNVVEMSQQPMAAMQSGGLIGMAAGGRFEGKVPGQGHGMEDNVYMPIKEGNQQVATLAVSPDEYVVDAHTMSALGNGNADEGAKYMDSMVKNIRQKAFGTDKQPNEINGLAALRPMIERV
tara:strand:+ start:225 stop:851 length:627 start_codon:yes stop_codon:yes gene_type:complete